VTNKIEKNETAAVPAHVANQVNQIGFAKVVAEVHGEGDVGERQGITECVGAKDWNRRGDTGVRINIDTNHVYCQSTAYLFQDETGGTSDIQNTSYGKRIPANGADHQVGVSEPPVDSSDVPVCAFD
jgi:hypothetical protein